MHQIVRVLRFALLPSALTAHVSSGLMEGMGTVVVGCSNHTNAPAASFLRRIRASIVEGRRGALPLCPVWHA